MRRILISALLLACGTLSGGARAGVYLASDNPADQPIGPLVTKDEVKPLPYELFKGALDAQRGLLADKLLSKEVEQKRQEILKKIAALQGKVFADSATVNDQINLSAYLIWTGKYTEAVQLLDPLARGEQRGNFMVLSNLATAYQLAGQMERAPGYLQQARDHWPEIWPGLTPEQLKFYRQVENYQLRQLLRRQAEANQPGGGRRQHEGVDAIFGSADAPVRFVGAGGQYEAGALAPAEKEKLPKDALAIVQQLCLWQPLDTRLYWQYGELLNAQGPEYINEAYKVLEECVDPRNWDSTELRAHRRTLLENRPQPPAAQTPPSILPERHKLVLGGVAAVVVIGLLGYFQYRELRRRRS
ncbi:MAG: hypothetical protein JNM56_18285 [Planctomycetia bacterium]|nr:hypothetical protein [Planctomycetia bacterium]